MRFLISANSPRSNNVFLKNDEMGLNDAERCYQPRHQQPENKKGCITGHTAMNAAEITPDFDTAPGG